MEISMSMLLSKVNIILFLSLFRIFEYIFYRKFDTNWNLIITKNLDACPECKYGDLDLTPPVFKALGDLDTGILKISWHEI